MNMWIPTKLIHTIDYSSQHSLIAKIMLFTFKLILVGIFTRLLELNVVNPNIYQQIQDTPILHYNKLSKHLIQPKGYYHYLLVYHNEIQSVVSLMKYWKRHDGVFFVDNSLGIDPRQVDAYLKKCFRGGNVETVFVNTDLEGVLRSKTERYLNFIIFCSETVTMTILQIAKSLNMFSGQNAWIILTNSTKKLFIPETKPMESQITVLLPKNNYIDYYDVFYSHQTKNIELIKFANWTNEKGLHIFEKLDAKDTVLGLRGRNIRTAGFNHVPYVSVAKVNNSAVFSGYSVDVMEMILGFLNVNFTKMQLKPDFGALINGTYTGVIGYLHRREVDASLNILLMVPVRRQVARYMTPITKLDMAMTYRTPESSVPPTTYLLPFSWSLWAFLFAFLVFIFGLLAFVMAFSPTWVVSSGLPVRDVHSKEFRVLTGTFLEEVLKDPPGITSRIIYVTLVITTMIVFIFYTSVFTSFLTHRELKMPIRNFRDLIESKEYNAMTVKHTKYADVFQRAQSGIFRDLWAKMMKKETLSLQDTIFLAILKMYEGKNVFLGDGASIIAAMQNNCTISLVRTPFFREYGYIVTRMDFPYDRILSMSMLRLREGGILRRLGKIYMTDTRPECKSSSSDPSVSLGIEQVVGLFFILAFGICLCYIGMMIEIKIIKAQANS